MGPLLDRPKSAASTTGRRLDRGWHQRLRAVQRAELMATITTGPIIGIIPMKYLAAGAFLEGSVAILAARWQRPSRGGSGGQHFIRGGAAGQLAEWLPGLVFGR